MNDAKQNKFTPPGQRPQQDEERGFRSFLRSGLGKFLLILVPLVVVVIVATILLQPPQSRPASQSASPSATANSASSSPTKSPKPTVTPTNAGETPDAIAKKFVAILADGKSGQDWANEMKPIVDWPMYQSFEHADARSVPTDRPIVDTAVQNNADGTYNVLALDKDKNTIYTFCIQKYTPMPGKPSIYRVIWVNLPDQGGQKDSSGMPIMPPPTPLNSDERKNLVQMAYSTVQSLVDFDAATSTDESRIQQVKNKLGGGQPPALLDTEKEVTKPNSRIRAKIPNEMYFQQNFTADRVQEGNIDVVLNVSYSDLASNNPSATLGTGSFVVTLQYRNDAWTPVAMQASDDS